MLEKTLKLFGIETVARHKFILVKHTKDGDIYYRCSVDGVPDFCLKKEGAWKFCTAEKAAEARKLMGIWYRTMSIYEVADNEKGPANMEVHAQ